MINLSGFINKLKILFIYIITNKKELKYIHKNPASASNKAFESAVIIHAKINNIPMINLK